MFKKRFLATVPALLTVMGSGFAQAQGFDDSSFEGPNSAGTPPVVQAETGSARPADGFDEGSFDNGGRVSGLAPVDTDPTNGTTEGATGGFDDGSFQTDDASTPQTETVQGVVGGDDFPGGPGIEFEEDETANRISEGHPDDQGTSDDVVRDDVVDPGLVFDEHITAMETRDFGVPPQNTLRQGQMHGPTPVAIPGANVVTTANLVEAFQGNIPMVLIDVFGADYTIPGAFTVPDLAASGHFRDRTQQRSAAWLTQITQGDRDTPIVVFCTNPMCWLSYNGVLRTVNAGFTNVYWYRGGLQAWQMAGLQLHPAGF